MGYEVIGDNGTVHARVKTVQVAISMETKRSRPLTDAEKKILQNDDLLAQVEGFVAEGGYKTELVSDEEHSLSSLLITFSNGQSVTFDYGVASFVEFTRSLELRMQLDEKFAEPFKVEEDGKKTDVATRDELLEQVMTSAKKDLAIQRYKGLGEMNPEQLWETTMDPEKRTLLQVKIEDAVETDSIFTVLMGDQVEPRRKFIEDNALEAKNLDI